jgi:hypothetical protein
MTRIERISADLIPANPPIRHIRHIRHIRVLFPTEMAQK